MTPCRRWLFGCLLLSLALLAGCAARGDATRPIPFVLVHAALPATRVVVMLPGRGDDVASMQREGVAQLIQRQWPDADVVLTGLTMPYYLAGVATRRLHDEVMTPLEQRGYRQVWMAGISLGGMGTLLYDQAYPDEVHGMLLLSPYLGDHAIHQEIRAAGGLAAWQPGPLQPIGPKTFQRELWRYLQQWSQRPGRTRTVWLAYGDSERFRKAIALMIPQLPADHVLHRPGHHDWKLWRTTFPALLRASAAGQPH